MTQHTHKVCTSCSADKALTEFHAKRGVPGASSQCRECVNSKSKAWYEANRDRANAQKAERYRENAEANAEYRRAYYLANREATIERARAWRAANRDRADRYRREYYEANRDEAIANTKKWAGENPERRSEQRRKYWARRRTNGTADIGPIDYDELWTGSCGICGEAMDRDLPYPDPMSKSIDHIVPLARGGPHEQSNLQWAHLVCNTRKGARHDSGEVA